MSHLAACDLKDVSPTVPGHLVCFTEVAARGICFELMFSTNFVKYTRESDCFSKLIVLGGHEAMAYKTPRQVVLMLRPLRRCHQQHIVFASRAKSLRFNLTELVTHAGGFFKLQIFGVLDHELF